MSPTIAYDGGQIICPPSTDAVREDELDQFWELLCSDEELLNAQFDAIIAGEWPDQPRPSGGHVAGHRPVEAPEEEQRRPGRLAPPSGRPCIGRVPRQRSPPREATRAMTRHISRLADRRSHGR